MFFGARTYTFGSSVDEDGLLTSSVESEQGIVRNKKEIYEFLVWETDEKDISYQKRES